jgi:hypothetical protein
MKYTIIIALITVFAFCFYFNCNFTPGMHILSVKKESWGYFKVDIINNSFHSSTRVIVFNLYNKNRKVFSDKIKVTLHPLQRVVIGLGVSNQVSSYDSYDIYLWKEG